MAQSRLLHGSRAAKCRDLDAKCSQAILIGLWKWCRPVHAAPHASPVRKFSSIATGIAVYASFAELLMAASRVPNAQFDDDVG